MTKLPSTLKLSRSSLKLFQECKRCFWLDLHHKVKRPPGYPYTLSAAVDYLVKQEFDKYREKGTLPPVFAKYFEVDPAQSLSADRHPSADGKGRTLSGASAKLFSGPELSEWRNNFKGVSYFDEDLNAILYGAVDDVLEFSDGSLAVVDYKSSGSKEITIYDDYKKQMDIYNFILSRKGYQTQPNAYFVFYQVDKTGGGFSNVLPFREELKTVNVNKDWVSDVFEKAVKVARQEEAPQNLSHCDHCHYVKMASQLLNGDINT